MKMFDTRITTVVAVTVLASLCLAGAADKMVTLEVKKPKPQFQGTPVPVKLPNLDPNTGKPRPPFMVPEGTTLLSAKKDVTSSDAFPVIGELKMITDADKEATDGSYVELGRGKQWVQIDLGAKASVYAIVAWFYHAQPRVYHDVVVQISDDKDFISDVKTVFNNDHDNSSGFGVGKDFAFIEHADGRLIDAKGTAGRYIRINTNGNTSNEMNHYIEVEVFGKAK